MPVRLRWTRSLVFGTLAMLLTFPLLQVTRANELGKLTKESLLKRLKERDRQFDNMTVLVRTNERRREGFASTAFVPPPRIAPLVGLVTVDHRLTVRAQETTIAIEEKYAGALGLDLARQERRTSNSSGIQLTKQTIRPPNQLPARTQVTRNELPNGLILLEQDRMIIEFCLGIGYGKRIADIQSIEQSDDEIKVVATMRLYDRSDDELSQATLVIDNQFLVRNARLQLGDESNGLLDEFRTTGVLACTQGNRSVARTAHHKRWDFYLYPDGTRHAEKTIDTPYETESINFDIPRREYESLTEINAEFAD